MAVVFHPPPPLCKSWRCVLVQTGHVTCYTGAGLGQTYTACLNYFNIDCFWVTMWHTTGFSACSSCKVFRFRGGKCLSFKVIQKVKYSVLSCAFRTRWSMKTQSTFQFLPSFLSFFSFFLHLNAWACMLTAYTGLLLNTVLVSYSSLLLQNMMSINKNHSQTHYCLS